MSRAGKLQIPHLMKPLQNKDPPFEKYAHFIVAPANTSEKGYQSNKKSTHHNTSSRSQENTKKTISPPVPQPRFPTTKPPCDGAGDADLDNYIIEASTTSVVEATEKFFMNKFNASAVIYWEDIPNLQQLYSQSYSLLSQHNNSLAGFSFFTRSVIRTNTPTTHQSFSREIDGKIIGQDGPVLVFPLFDYKNNLCSVVQIYKSPGSPEFTESHEQFTQTFAYKFKLFSRFIFSNHLQEPMLLDIMGLNNTNTIVKTITTRLANFFGCRACEIWKLDRTKNIISRYIEDSIIEDVKECGIVGDVLKNLQVTNCQKNKIHPNYNPEVDFEEEEAFLAIPVLEASGQFTFVTVLRGPSKLVFTPADEDNLGKFSPFIALSISNSDLYSLTSTEFDKTKSEREGLTALLEVAEVLSGQLDTGKLTEIIMEKGRLLTKADRCSLFLVNRQRDRLITSFQRGLENAINIPIDKGIAGQTVKEATVFNITDAYEWPTFDSSTDLESGYRTRTILSVPIFNNRGEVIGVTEMVNRQGGQPFSQWDSHMIQIFNVFCGISLENARLYKESVDMSQQLRSFFDVSFSLSQSESIHRILSDIIHNARQVIDASRASLFLVDEQEKVFTSFIADGGKLPPTLPLTAGIAGACAQSKECIVVNNAYEDPRFNRSIDIGTGFKTDSLCVAPILSSTGDFLGVVEMVNKKPPGFEDKDVKLLQSFATFAAVSLENSKLKDLAMTGSVDIEIDKYVKDSEKGVHPIPVKLKLTEEEKEKASRLNFFSIEWQGLGHIKLLFFLFDKFNLLDNYKISNEMFFRYIFELRSHYNDVPYHNWIHACDVTQYVSYELFTANADKLFTSLELFALIVAATCHDANHDGFNNVYNVKAETPLGILFKDQSVMETHHCSQAINILTKEEFNLMHVLSPIDTKRMWNMIIALILATDMAFHFKFVKEMNEIIDANGKMDANNNDHRILMMKMLLKVADISNVSRPFDLADKWCDVLCEEFFRQGDNERQQGLELTSPLNDREHSNKPQSQIGFYNFICLPLYNVVARAFPELSVNVESVKSNLDVWKSMIPPAPPAA